MTGAKTVKSLHVLAFVTDLLQLVTNMQDLVHESRMINAVAGRSPRGGEGGRRGARGYAADGVGGFVILCVWGGGGGGGGCGCRCMNTDV